MAKKPTSTAPAKTSKRKAKATAKQRTQKVHYPEELPAVYANDARWTMSSWDITLDFGILETSVPVKEGDLPAVAVHTRVIMSPQYAKKFAQRLTESLRGYDKDFRTLRTEPKNE